MIVVPATLVFLGLIQSAQGSSSAHIDVGSFGVDIPRQEFLPFAFSDTDWRANTIVALNIPGMATEILVSLPTSWPDSWRPVGWTLDAWRSVIFPFYSLPFLWFTGLGMDSLLARKRLNLGALLLGSILFLLFVILFIGFCFGMPASERADSDWILWGLGLWSLLFAVFPYTWLRQRRPSVAN
jgi:hypothetical protein